MDDDKKDFLNYEFATSSMIGALSMGFKYPVYKKKEKIKEIDIDRRNDFKDFLRDRLFEYWEKYKNEISPEKHIKNLKKFQVETKNYSKILNDGKLTFGRVQKLLNLYLKYLWVANLIPMPPHCPFDSGIIKELKELKLIQKVYSWQNMIKREYEIVVSAAEKHPEIKKLKLAQWELKFFNETRKKK